MNEILYQITDDNAHYGRFPVLCLLILSSSLLFAGQNADSPSPLQLSNAYITILESFRENIANMESEYGVMDQRLVEPLNDLARFQMEAGYLDDALSSLNRQLQIERINNGLYSQAQIPIIESLISASVSLKDWEQVEEHYNRLAWIYTKAYAFNIDKLLTGIDQISNWSISAIYVDDRKRTVNHLLRLLDLRKHSLDLATMHFGTSDPILVPHLYNLAVSHTYIGLAILSNPLNRSFDTDLMVNKLLSRTEAIGNPNGVLTNTVLDSVFQRNINKGIGYLKAIQKIYSDSKNQEAEAMVAFSIADWYLIRHQYESPGTIRRASSNTRVTRGSQGVGVAMRHYREAIDLLLDSGVEQSAIDEYLSCPRLVPAHELEIEFTGSAYGCSENMPKLELTAWSNMIYGLDLPGYDGLIAKSPGEEIEVEIEFSVRVNGQPRVVEINSAVPDSVGNRVRARQQLTSLQFRPVIYDDRARRFQNMTMTLKIAPRK